MNITPKRLSDITREEWVKWYWINVTGPTDIEPVFVQGAERTQDAIARAMAEWDSWREAME
jgi:hypothetical protein